MVGRLFNEDIASSVCLCGWEGVHPVIVQFAVRSETIQSVVHLSRATTPIATAPTDSVPFLGMMSQRREGEDLPPHGWLASEVGNCALSKNCEEALSLMVLVCLGRRHHMDMGDVENIMLSPPPFRLLFPWAQILTG